MLLLLLLLLKLLLVAYPLTVCGVLAACCVC
jgi:hypothetical protein